MRKVLLGCAVVAVALSMSVAGAAVIPVDADMGDGTSGWGAGSYTDVDAFSSGIYVTGWDGTNGY